MKDNFWQMGDTGPCGPCSEIHYDMGVAASDQGHTDCRFGCDCGRYVELWNLVFMQYDRQPGFTKLLPKPSIDTGMGLERLAAVLQGVISNYETDLFTPLIARAAKLVLFPNAPEDTVSSVVEDPVVHDANRLLMFAGRDPVRFSHPFLENPSLRIIADHARAATFLIGDGVLPSNEGRGYVLRKILRRGIRHGRLQGQEDPFLYQMVYAVRDLMKDAYPELIESADGVAKVIEAEERQFDRVLKIGLDAWEKRVRELALESLAEKRTSGFRSSSEEKILEFHKDGTNVIFPGKDAFRLYETYGLPLDFMTDAARDVGIHFDLEGFEQARAEEQVRARASWKGAAKQTANPAYQQLPKSEFEGYRRTRSDNCEVLAIIKGGQGAQELKPGESGEVILDHTPFYAESGGQVGDRGWFYSCLLYTSQNRRRHQDRGQGYREGRGKRLKGGRQGSEEGRPENCGPGEVV